MASTSLKRRSREKKDKKRVSCFLARFLNNKPQPPLGGEVDKEKGKLR
jgi:hypothetical protein